MTSKVYVAQYIRPLNNLQPSPLINSRETRIIVDEFECDHKTYGKLGIVMEIKYGKITGSLINPYTIIVNSDDEHDDKIFLDKIATVVNAIRDDKITFESPADNDQIKTKIYMKTLIDEIKAEGTKNNKSNHRWSIVFTICGILGGVAVSYILTVLNII